jgi:O-antigen/teichoic acid export membrane protein
VKKNEIKSGAIIGYINMIANIIVTFVYTPIMLKLMGNEEFGLYSLVSSVISYLSVLDMGFGNAMIRFISKAQAKKEYDKEKEINGLFLILYSAIGIITIFIGIALINNIQKLFPALTQDEIGKAKVIMEILILTIAISFPLSIFDSYVMACEKFKFLKILNLVKTISIPLTMLPLLFLGYKAIAMVIVTSIFNIMYHICTLLCCFKKLNMKIYISKGKFNVELFKNIFNYSFFVFLGLIVDTVFNNTDQVILGSVCGTVAVSIYSVGSKIINMNTTVSTTLSGLFLPKITKMLEEKEADYKISNLFLKVSRIQIYLMVLISSGFIVYGKQFLNLWVGGGYEQTYYIILLIILPALIPLTQNIGISIIQAKNKHQFRSVVYFIIAIINVILTIPLAKRFEGIGAAIGTLIATFLGQILVMNIFYWKKIKLDIPKYWKFLIIFLLKVSVITVLNMIIIKNIEFNWIKLILGIIIYITMYTFIVLTTMKKKYT